ISYLSTALARRQSFGYDHPYARVLGYLADRLDIGDHAAWIGDRLYEDRLGSRAYRALERADVVRLGPHHVPAEVLECVVELIDRAAIKLLGGDEFVAGLHQAMHGHDLGGVA